MTVIGRHTAECEGCDQRRQAGVDPAVLFDGGASAGVRRTPPVIQRP